MEKLQTTQINIDAKVRQSLVTVLNQREGVLTDLYVQTKLAHWNVRGAHFMAYHELFDQIAEHILGAQDTMAERAAQLGGQAGMTLQSIAQETILPVWPIDVRADREVMGLVSERLALVANLIRGDIDRATELGDADTADLLTEVSRQLDKDLWFIEAHLDA